MLQKPSGPVAPDQYAKALEKAMGGGTGLAITHPPRGGERSQRGPVRG